MSEQLIDRELLDSVGDNWMICTDNDGVSYGGFAWQPVGQWTECPIWSDKTKADCVSGGLFGQGPGGYGYAKEGARFKFCETGPERISVGGDKIKVRRAKILYTDQAAYDALVYICRGRFQGSLYIGADCKLDALTSVGGYLDIGADCKLDALTSVGGDLDIRADCKLDALTSVGGDLYIGADCKLDALTSVGGSLYIGADCKLDAPNLKRG